MDCGARLLTCNDPIPGLKLLGKLKTPPEQL